MNPPQNSDDIDEILNPCKEADGIDIPEHLKYGIVCDHDDGWWCEHRAEKVGQALQSFLDQKVREARIDELEKLNAARGRFSTSGYSIWVGIQIEDRLEELNKAKGKK